MSNKRAERKRLAKYGSIYGQRPTLTFDKYVYYFYLALVDALYCVYGMPTEQIVELFNKVNTTIDCLMTDYITLRDIETMTKEEVGIEFVEKLKKKSQEVEQ